MAEPNPGEIQIEKAHAVYILRLYPHRSVVLTAQQLLAIMDYALLHAEQLRQEAAQAQELDRKSKGLSVESKQDGRAHQQDRT